MTGLTLAVVLQTATMATGDGGESYTDAYQSAMSNGAPIVVFVSTEWCAPCQQMKRQILPEVRKRGLLGRVCFAQVDPDVEHGLARQLIGSGPVPQLLMFRSTRSGWMRRRLVGSQNVATVENFINEGLEATKKAESTAGAAVDDAQPKAGAVSTVSR